MSDVVRLDREGPLAILTVSKPPLNLYARDVYDGLVAALDDLTATPARGLLVRAEGDVWTGGVDVNEFDGLAPDEARVLWNELLHLIHRVEGESMADVERTRSAVAAAPGVATVSTSMVLERHLG